MKKYEELLDSCVALSYAAETQEQLRHTQAELATVVGLIKYEDLTPDQLEKELYKLEYDRRELSLETPYDKRFDVQKRLAKVKLLMGSRSKPEVSGGEGGRLTTQEKTRTFVQVHKPSESIQGKVQISAQRLPAAVKTDTTKQLVFQHGFLVAAYGEKKAKEIEECVSANFDALVKEASQSKNQTSKRYIGQEKETRIKIEYNAVTKEIEVSSMLKKEEQGATSLVKRLVRYAVPKKLTEEEALSVYKRPPRGQSKLPGLRQPLVEELQTSRALQGVPNLVQMTERNRAGGDKSLKGYVMPDLRGGSLKSRLSKTGVARQPSDRPLLLKWASQIGHAVAGMHEKGIIHVDIKPANAMLDTAGNARLIDFGSAVPSKQPGTGHGGMTPLYMPPEAWDDGFKPNESSDTYSYAVMQCEMFYGEDINPVSRLTPQESGEYYGGGKKAKSLFERKLQELRGNLEKKLPDPMAQLLLQCLDQNPAQRPLMSKVVSEIDRIK